MEQNSTFVPDGSFISPIFLGINKRKVLVMAEFLLGVNYWPRTSAMAMWTRFDRGEIDEDLARIAGLGFGVIRFFLIWECFQPCADTMDRAMLKRLDWFIERIAARRLRAMPTFFTGHMSGVNWLPTWTLDHTTRAERFRTICAGGESLYGIGDFYTGALLEAQRLHVRAVGQRFHRHPTILAWDLGNEFTNLREPRGPQDAAMWSTILTEDLREVSDLDVTGGIHGEDITRDRNVRLSSLCAPWTYATMHGYSVYSDFARGPMDIEVVPFLAEVTRSCAGKPVLFSEFGNPTCSSNAGVACLTEEEMPVYARGILEHLSASGVLGAFWWCWADYAKELVSTPPFDRAPHEVTFGIVRNDGTEKPIATELARFARERRTVVLSSWSPIVDEETYFATLPAGVALTYAEYVRR
jgi:endo-1,4-beta-mannosidase